jgi:alpha-aminoadipate/glutamate carrier protein LysW
MQSGLAKAGNRRITVIFREDFFMVECPVCDGKIDVDEEDVDEGDTISCDECGAALKVVGTEPLEIESAEEAEEEDEEDDGFVEEEEEEADEEWH